MDPSPRGCNRVMFGRAWIGALATIGVLSFASVAAAATLNGQVLGAGAPIANSTVTLFAASAGAPQQLAQATTGADGRFALNAPDAPGKDTILYLVAKGGTPKGAENRGANEAIALLALLHPAHLDGLHRLLSCA